MPGILQGRQPTIDSSALRVRCPATSISASPCRQPLPDLPRRRRLRHPRQARRYCHSRPPAPASSRSPSRNCRRALYGLQHALLRLRTWSAGDPDPLRHLPGQSTFTPWDSSLDIGAIPQPVFTLDTGPGGSLSRPDETLFSQLSGWLAQKHRRRSLSFTLELARADGDQNLNGSRSPLHLASWRRSVGFPTAPTQRLPAAPPGYTGLRRRQPQLPGRVPGRDGDAASGRVPSGLRTGRCISPVLTRARHSAWP